MNNNLSVLELMSKSWKDIKGTKLSIWIAFLLIGIFTVGICLAILYILTIILNCQFNSETILALSSLTLLIGIPITHFVSVYFYTKIIAIILNKVKGLPIDKPSLYQHNHMRWFYVFLTYMIQNIISTSIYYLMVGHALWFYYLVSILANTFLLINVFYVLDQNKNPIIATWLSIKTVWGNFPQALSVFFIGIASLILGFLTLGIGLIWAIPFSYLLCANFYMNTKMR